MAKKFRILLLFVSLAFTLCIMSNTYSRYVADTTGNLEAVFAKWQILVNDSDITNNASSSIVLAPVIEQNQYIAKNKVAPSSKGYVDIDIDPTNVDVSFDYKISLALKNINMPDLLITKYSIIDSTYTEGTTLVENIIQNNTIEGTLNYNNSIENYKYEPFTIRIYFEWYEGKNESMDDEEDTQASINNESFTINANINFTQKII